MHTLTMLASRTASSAVFVCTTCGRRLVVDYVTGDSKVIELGDPHTGHRWGGLSVDS